MPKTAIGEELYQYALNFGVHEHAVAQKLRDETAKLTNSRMQISRDQGQLMGLLAKVIAATNYLEIGVFTGYSSLVMALAMGAKGQVVGLDNNPEYINIARQFWRDAGVEDKIEIIIGNAVDSCEKLLMANRQFDIAFIDANKTDYPLYYEYCYKMVRPGGLILVDNVLYHGEVLNSNPSNSVKAIKQVNQLIYNDARVDISMLPIADGLTIAYKKELQ